MFLIESRLRDSPLKTTVIKLLYKHSLLNFLKMMRCNQRARYLFSMNLITDHVQKVWQVQISSNLTESLKL